ncbi:hypothetical protein BC831DRAFT_509426 [Entophlyctis helioformis]|nr:hypothetical protein BC831DRAFT_509426 [Entophlyctis helioformis]
MYFQIDSADCRGATPVKWASDASDTSAVDAQDAGATIVSLIRTLQDAVPVAFSVEQNASIGRSGRKADFVIRKQGGDVRAVGKVASTRLMADSDGVESGIGDAQELVRMYHDESKSGSRVKKDNSRIHLVDSNPATCMCNRGRQLATAHVQDAVDAHRRSHQGAVPAQDEHGHERRHLTVRLHEELGKGQLATVRRGCYHGHQVAVKMVWLQDPHAAFDVHTALRNELGMYKALQAIQGDAVPMLYDVVKTSDMVCLVMQLGGQRVGVWGDEERRLARAALAKIHALGYLHGGVRRANVVFVTAYVGVLDKAIFKAEMDAIAQL